MSAGTTLTRPDNLKLYKPHLFSFGPEPQEPETPNEWFVKRYPDQYEVYGSPFLELVETVDAFNKQVSPITLNIDFFGAVLGGRRDLGHHVIYLENEMAWYFKDIDNIYKPTTADKLANQYRALLIRCASDMPPEVHKLNLVHEWRADKVAKQVINRAKSILLAESSFFCATSSHERIKGIELHERLAMRFVDELLTAEPGKILMLHDAYAAFCSLLKQRELNIVKQSDFKAMVVPYIKDEYNVSLRNDLSMDGRQGVRGWKDLKLNQAMPA